MSASSFAKILSILELFSVQRSAINVDLICQELGVSKPMAYRYLKELVDAGLLKKAYHCVGDYTLGHKVAVLDYIARTTDPWIQISIPYMQDVVQRTEMLCLLTTLDGFSCIDVHHENFAGKGTLIYGRGCPRQLVAGSSAKVILAHLTKKQQLSYYPALAEALAQKGFAQNAEQFVQYLREIKKQGFYLSKGELNPQFSSLSVPLKFSAKEAPWALTVVASANRFEYMNIEKIIEMLKQVVEKIEKQVLQEPVELS